MERMIAMNNNNFSNNKPFYGKQDFPGTPIYVGNNVVPNQQTAANYSTELPMEQSYIENILILNKGKKARVHMTFPDSTEWRDLEFNGIIEQSGRDHIILYLSQRPTAQNPSSIGITVMISDRIPLNVTDVVSDASFISYTLLL